MGLKCERDKKKIKRLTQGDIKRFFYWIENKRMQNVIVLLSAHVCDLAVQIYALGTLISMIFILKKHVFNSTITTAIF